MRPLGKTQKELLRCLEDHGQWFRGCGWVWDTPSNTKAILETLVKRGLVVTGETPRGLTTYKLKNGE